MKVGVNAKAVKEHGGVGFRFPAVHLGELALQLACPDSVLVGKILLGINGVLLLHNLIKTLVPHNHCVHDRIFIVFKMVLLKDGQTLSGSDGHVAVCGVKLPGKDF